MASARLPLVSCSSSLSYTGISLIRCKSGGLSRDVSCSSSLQYPGKSRGGSGDWRVRRCLDEEGIEGRRFGIRHCDGSTHRTSDNSLQYLKADGRQGVRALSCGSGSTMCSSRFGVPGVAFSRLHSAARAVAVEAVDPPQELTVEEVVIGVNASEGEPKLAEGDGGAGNEGGDNGGGGGGGDGGGDEEKVPRMSMSQTLTLIYAFLVGGGGLMGFAKSGSYKSLAAGGGAALALFFVYAQLPVNPAVASSVGLGISAVLLGIMYPRFKKSGKFMPAGLVSLISLIMTGGYLHGIVRTTH